MAFCNPSGSLVGGNGCKLLGCHGPLHHFIQRTRYHLSPYTYFIGGILGQLIGRQEIHCSPVEFVTLNPPARQTCARYMERYISSAGGYLTNPKATSSCQFCSVKSSDKLLADSINIFYDHHWRDFGIMVAYIAFNVGFSLSLLDWC